MPARCSHKTWLARVLLSLAGLLVLFALFNCALDPLWCFVHPHWFTTMQRPFNERQQKTNFLTFVNRKHYDTLILGNSRTTLIDPNQFRGMSAFNYSLAAMTPYEYRAYINYFQKTVGTPKTIILGLDFDNTNGVVKYAVQPPEVYLKEAQSPLYRYRTLLSYDTFNFARDNLFIDKFIRRSKSGAGTIIYNRDLVATLLKPRDAAVRSNFIAKEVADLHDAYQKSYSFREDLAQSLRQLKAEYPGSRFIAFTTPVSKLHYCTLVQDGKFPEYERWLREMVSVYGELWHFQYLNSVTRDYDKNYSDTNHFYAPIGTLVAHKISGVPDANIPADFGMLLNPDNIDQAVATIKAESAAGCN